MKSIRLFLYALIGTVLLALWSAWQHDYPTQPSTAKQEATTAVSSATDLQKDAKLNPVVGTTATNSLATVTKTPDHRLITVHTDVLEVAIDRDGGNIVSAKLLKYNKPLPNKDQPVQLLSDNPTSFYVAKSGLHAKVNGSKIPGKISYNAMQRKYVLSPGQKELQVKLLWHNKHGVVISKIFTFARGKYDIGLNFNINNRGRKNLDGKIFLELTQKALPKKHAFFAFRTFTGASISSSEKAYEKLSYASLSKQDLSRTIKGGWLAFQQHYFLSAWAPNQDQTYNYYSKTQADDNLYTLGLTQDISVPEQGKANFENKLYLGPEVASKLKTIAPHLDETVDYGKLWFISVAIFWVMQQIHKILGNWGWSIILVTLLIKLMFYKFSAKSYASMAKMRKLAPRIKEMQQRFANDKKKLSQATMALYAKEKVNPLGGCLPILVQIPVFIALYYVLVEAVELRQSPFIFWIQDLSVKDPYFILPILMGISMLVQQKLNPPAPDPMQAKMMMLLPVVFTIFFSSFPAGLVLYWLANNCLSALQQWYIMRNV